MAFSVELVRPDDLLYLHVDVENLHVDQREGEPPALILEDAALPAFLIVRFPPQTIVEEAIYESSATQTLADETGDKYKYNEGKASPPAVQWRTRCRVGHPSRLVFRIPAGSTLRIPFTIAGLLDWANLDLSVSPLAALPPDPTLTQRLAAPGIAAPTRHDTAIELPYRLVLSPNAEVAWRHSLEAKARNGVVTLWHTRLALRDAAHKVSDISRAQRAPLRAIWSPDYHAQRFVNTDEPRFGDPDQDWNPKPILTPMTPSDRHEIVALTSAFSGYIRDLDDYRWYAPRPIFASRLMLSALGGWLTSRGEWDPPATYRRPPLRLDAAVETWSQHLSAVDHAAHQVLPVARFGDAAADHGGEASPARAQPAPVAANLAAQKVEAAFNPIDLAVPLTSAARFDAVDQFIDPRQWADRRGTKGMLLNLSEWSHIATLGRDHYVRIVYEGFLFPFGHRAALIKITERKIVDDAQRGTIAHLFQRSYIVVREPLRNYRDPEVFAQLEDGGRSLPFRTMRLTTLITPDIANPNQAEGQIVAGRKAFWVRLGTGKSGADNFRFHAIGEDSASHRLDFTAALVFVPNSEITGPVPSQEITYASSGIPAIKAAYDNAGAERLCAVPAQQLALMDGGGENATLVTHGLYFTVQPARVNKRFGGFLPKLFKANVQVPAVDLMVGSSGRLDVALHDAYLKQKLDNVNELFAWVVKEPTSGTLAAADSRAAFQAKDAGGLATPDLAITSLTRKLGPLAGTQLDKAAKDEFDPVDFFGTMASARLFGTFPLTELISSPAASAGAPRMQVDRTASTLVGTLTWKPQVKDVTAGVAAFEAIKDGTAATLTVTATVTKTVDSPAPPATVIEGELKSFSVVLLHVVRVRFDSFIFKSHPGKKPDVGVALDKGDPVEFLDDLKFVQALKDTLPPDLFGDGPSLDINAQRIKAGFSVGLPPISLGVFLLRDLSFGAFMELPFADGKPLLDFAFCRREKPFNLTVAFLGGGGFFHLQTDTLGVKLLEAALEFGASAAVNLGVASGGVHIMAGVYFSLQRKGSSTVLTATLGGYLRMGGELSVLGLISVSLEFYLGFTYDGKAAHGIATLTVKVQVLCFSASVAITVEKSFGGSDGDPAFEQTFTTPAVWLEYADAFA